MKQIWKELPKHMDTPVAPLDEEMLVDLAKEPAVIEGGRYDNGSQHKGGSRGFEKVGLVMVLPTTFPGWWFGTFFPPIVGMMIQSDEVIFFRGVAKNHQPVVV